MSENGFKKWMREVERELVNRCGMGSQDIADWEYRDAFDDDMIPSEAAQAAIEDAGIFVSGYGDDYSDAEMNL